MWQYIRKTIQNTYMRLVNSPIFHSAKLSSNSRYSSLHNAEDYASCDGHVVDDEEMKMGSIPHHESSIPSSSSVTLTESTLLEPNKQQQSLNQIKIQSTKDAAPLGPSIKPLKPNPPPPVELSFDELMQQACRMQTTVTSSSLAFKDESLKSLTKAGGGDWGEWDDSLIQDDLDDNIDHIELSVVSSHVETDSGGTLSNSVSDDVATDWNVNW